MGEVVQRIDGRPYNQYVRDAIFLPLGMHPGAARTCILAMSSLCTVVGCTPAPFRGHLLTHTP